MMALFAAGVVVGLVVALAFCALTIARVLRDDGPLGGK